jgi:hypothetical protein
MNFDLCICNMAGSKNIIRKQTLHFQYNGNADGFALQKDVSDWCNFNLIPEIEQQLEEFSQNDNYLSIDKLEINAEVDSKNWKQKIRDELIYELKQKISRYKPELPDIKKTTEGRDAKLDKLIIFYLKTGYLPWWGRAFLVSDFKTVFRNWVTEEKFANRIEFIRKELEQIVSQKVVARIVNKVPDKLFFQFLKHIYDEQTEIIIQFEAFFESFILNKISEEEQIKITKPVYVLILYSILKNKGKIEIESILSSICKELDVFQILPKIIKRQPEEASVMTNPVVRSWQKIVINEQKKLKKERRLTPGKSFPKLLKAETENREVPEAETQEGIYIDNAGAVIFAAFIPALFEKLGITENGIIINPDLAALTIQYCVSGTSEIEEYELVLPKILCGLTIDFPVNTNIEILEEQKSESELMLHSLIGHWPVLKDTSVEGLREAFLNRSGKLSMINEEWMLNVEQKAYDMLLERIPWTFSIIKLPWMETLLKTEWI